MSSRIRASELEKVGLVMDVIARCCSVFRDPHNLAGFGGDYVFPCTYHAGFADGFQRAGDSQEIATRSAQPGDLVLIPAPAIHVGE